MTDETLTPQQALYKAIKEQDFDAIDAALANGAQIDDDNGQALRTAAYNTDYYTFRYLFLCGADLAYARNYTIIERDKFGKKSYNIEERAINWGPLKGKETAFFAAEKTLKNLEYYAKLSREFLPQHQAVQQEKLIAQQQEILAALNRLNDQIADIRRPVELSMPPAPRRSP